MSNENSRSRLGDRARPGRNGRDGRDGTDGRKGEKGDKGERGQRGDDGKDGRDLALVPSIAQFDRDEDTHRTLRVRVVEIANAKLLMTLTPAYDEDGFLESAQITPA